MQKTNKSYTIKDIYNSYMSQYSGDCLYSIDYRLFRDILSDYMMYVSAIIILKAKEFKIPGNLGYLFVRKRISKKLNRAFMVVDPVESRRLKKRVYFLNDHSNGYSYSFRWTKIGAYVRNITMYELIMTRTNKRLLSRSIKNNLTDYII